MQMKTPTAHRLVLRLALGGLLVTALALVVANALSPTPSPDIVRLIRPTEASRSVSSPMDAIHRSQIAARERPDGLTPASEPSSTSGPQSGNHDIRQIMRSHSPLAEGRSAWQTGRRGGWRSAYSIQSACFEGGLAANLATGQIVKGRTNDFARAQAQGAIWAKCHGWADMGDLTMAHSNDLRGLDAQRADTAFLNAKSPEAIEKSLLEIVRNGGMPYDSSAARRLFDISQRVISDGLSQGDREQLADAALMHARILSFGSPDRADDLLMQVSCLKLDICQMSQFEAVRQKDPKGYDRIVRYMSWAYGAVEGAAPAASRPRP